MAAKTKPKLPAWNTLTPQQVSGRVKRLSGTPGTRYKIPTAYLPQKYQAARAAAVQNKALLGAADIGQPLSGQGLVNTATALTHAEIDPAVKAIEGQIGKQNAQGQALQERSTGYWQELLNKDAVPRALSEAQSSSAAYGDAVAKAGTGAADRLAAALGQGAGAGPGLTSLPGQAAQAASVTGQGRLGQQSADLQVEAANRGAADRTIAAAMPSIVASRGADQATQLAAQLATANQGLQEKAADTKASYGGKLVDRILSMRGSGVEEALASDKLNVNLKKIQADALQAQQADLTKRYGIDTQANTSLTNNANTVAGSQANNIRTTSASQANLIRKLAAQKGNNGLTSKQVRDINVARGTFIANVKNGRTLVQNNPDLLKAAHAGKLSEFLGAMKVAGIKGSEARAIYDLVTSKGGRYGASADTVAVFRANGWPLPKDWDKTK